MNAVLFDLDDTLYDRESAVESAADRLHGLYGRLAPAIAKGSFVERILGLDNHGYGDKTSLLATLAEEWQLDQCTAEAMLGQFWKSFYDGCRLAQDTKTTLETLRSRGAKLGIITNGSATSQNRKIEALGISAFMDVVLISEAEGLRKPDPAIFLRACARCGVGADVAIYVGDNPETDIAGAKAAGLTPVLMATRYRTVLAPECTVISRLSDVLAIWTDGTRTESRAHRDEDVAPEGL